MKNFEKINQIISSVGYKLGIPGLSLPSKEYRVTEVSLDVGDMYLECGRDRIFVVFISTMDLDLLYRYQKALQLCHYEHNPGICVSLMDRDRFVFSSFVYLDQLKGETLLNTILKLQNLANVMISKVDVRECMKDAQ